MAKREAKEIDEEENENGLKIGDWRLNLSSDTESHHQTKHRVRVVVVVVSYLRTPVVSRKKFK